ncbi:thermonuclease family protein, partial [Klebsiella pneumoniae]|uniref:thermonuclease family protein n=1 Tax=Klebsiella pneumoniae TaxID=573 RepID=UPI002032A2BC
KRAYCLKTQPATGETYPKSDLFNKAVSYTQTDRYGRVLGRVVTANGTEANRQQVLKGAAWVYDRYNTDNSLPALQREAQTQKRGLWADNQPVPPWEWRHKNN